MKYIVTIKMLLLLIKCYSQNDNGTTMQNAGQSMGRMRVNVFNTEQQASESGSPFFSDKWMMSTLILMDGKIQKGLMVRLDLFENMVYFLDEAGKENISTTPIKEVLLADTLEKRTYRFINSSAIKATGIEMGWYQLLCEGGVGLYKRITKKLPSNVSQSSDDEIKPLETSVQFFLLVNEKLFRIKKGKEIPELIKENKEQLQEYIRSKKLAGKSEEDMVAIVTFYNSLK